MGVISVHSFDPGFWSGKRVLVTGHTGFKGSWLSLWLQMMDAKVFGFALPAPTEPALFNEVRVGDGMGSFIGDVRDYPAVQDVFKKTEPEIVIHMAAQPLVRESYVKPIDTYATNVMGTVHVLEAARGVPSVRAIVVVTTDKCYENREWVWGYREDEPMGGHDPYSSSKGCAELVTSAYRRSFWESSGIATASARAGNVIGGGDWAVDRLVPDVLRGFTCGETVRVRNPGAVRPWQHVLEPLRGYLTLAQRLWVDGGVFADAWNFGPVPEDSQSVSWMVSQIAERWGQTAKWVIDDSQHPHEARYLRLEISKAQSLLNWSPAIRIGHALDLTIEWYAQFEAGVDMKKVTENQISWYQELTA